MEFAPTAQSRLSTVKSSQPTDLSARCASPAVSELQDFHGLTWISLQMAAADSLRSRTVIAFADRGDGGFDAATDDVQNLSHN